MLLLSGVPSDALAQWFGSELSPQKIIRLHRALDAACVAIDVLYAEHFHAALEGLLYRLAELRGLSRWYVRKPAVHHTLFLVLLRVFVRLHSYRY